MTTFNIDDKVIIKHQRELGICTVVNPRDPTNAHPPGRDPVGYYVRVYVDTKRPNEGYWAGNLEPTK